MDLAGLFLKSGVKNQRVALLLTDAQIPDERFLVIINDLLSSGQIQTPCSYWTLVNLYCSETKEYILSHVYIVVTIFVGFWTVSYHSLLVFQIIVKS